MRRRYPFSFVHFCEATLSRTFNRPLSSFPNISSPIAASLPQIKSRLGQCILFGMSEEQTQKAGQIAKILAEEWKGLVVGPGRFVVEEGLEEKVNGARW